MELLGERLYSTQEVIKVLGGLKRKMLDYIRNTLKLIPSPIKVSKGHGMLALYPDTSVKHLKRIMSERKKGLTFLEIKQQLEPDTDKVFGRSFYLRRQYELYKTYKAKFSASLVMDDHPELVIQIVDRNGEQISVEAKIKQVTQELRKDFEHWNGSIEDLSRIKRVIELLEQFQAVKSVRNGMVHSLK